MFINEKNKEMNCKIVYWGPGLAGRTTNLQYIYQSLDPARRGKMISLATETERTLFFDLSTGVRIHGYGLRLHLYTVPGPVYYDTCRNLVLKGLEGAICVFDSQRERMEANHESLEDLEHRVEAHGYRFSDLPLVYQYNKRDLPDVVDLPTMDRELNPRGRPSFGAVAIEGTGVQDTLDAVTRLVTERLRAIPPPSR